MQKINQFHILCVYLIKARTQCELFVRATRRADLWFWWVASMIYQLVLIRHLQHNEPALTLQAVKTKESTSRDQCCCMRCAERRSQSARGSPWWTFINCAFICWQRSESLVLAHTHTAQKHLSRGANVTRFETGLCSKFLMYVWFASTITHSTPPEDKSRNMKMWRFSSSQQSTYNSTSDTRAYGKYWNFTDYWLRIIYIEASGKFCRPKFLLKQCENILQNSSVAGQNSDFFGVLAFTI